MASLLPSEVARLVLGFLEENKCQKASECLLKELPMLEECAQLRRRGRKANLRIGNKSLEDMLADYTDTKDHVADCSKNYPASFSKVSSTDSLYEQVKKITSIVIEAKDLVNQVSYTVIHL
ncbi:uncharacterized protein [Cherax quadricarinatus]|uniref:uncharacterized protein n=1 Tax=Cherax quadricarinatus TaxID=27406 RepID=UPI00387EE03C